MRSKYIYVSVRELPLLFSFNCHSSINLLANYRRSNLRYLKTRTRGVLLSPHLSSSLFTSSPYPFHPPSILLLLFQVHLWPWRPPQETHQLCLGLQPSQFTSVYSTAVHVRVSEHYGLYISTQSQATIIWPIGCIFLCVASKQATHVGNTSISWADPENRPKQDVTQSL